MQQISKTETQNYITQARINISDQDMQRVKPASEAKSCRSLTRSAPCQAQPGELTVSIGSETGPSSTLGPGTLTTFRPVILQSALEIMVNIVFMLVNDDPALKGLKSGSVLVAAAR